MKQEITLSLTTLITSNLSEARYFYEELLGQVPTIDSEMHVMYKSGFSLWERNFAETLVFGDNKKPSETESFTHELCFESKDLQNLEKFLLEKDIKFLNPLKEQPWGQLVMRLYDPDGRVIELGEPLSDTVARIWLESGKNREETSKRTHIPLEVLNQYLPEV